MIEIVARVLFGWVHGHDQWDDAQPEEREDAIEAARAVMAAMEQPSRKMMDAAHDVGIDNPPEEYWRAMVTAELKSD